MADKPLFSIGVVADVQYADKDPVPQYDSYYRPSLWKFEDCVEYFNSQNLDFVIQLGDLVDQDMESFDPMLKIWAKIKAPKYHVMGNHELQDTAPVEQVMQKLSLKKPYYDFKYKNWRFVVIDTVELNVFSHPQDSAEHKLAQDKLDELKQGKHSNALPWNGMMSKEQHLWIEKTISDAEKNGEKVVVFGHYPFISPEPALTAWDGEKMARALRYHKNFVAYICGHDHSGGYLFYEGKHFLIMNGMMATPDTNAYAIFEFYPDRIEVKGIGRVPSRTLTFK